jgi:DNA repair exonuclease SbcCD ATPase subunit
MNRIQSLRTHLDQQKGRRSQIERHLDDLNNRVRDARRGLHRHEQAREIIREVGLRTQQQLQVHISDITSLALEAVFDDPYELVVEFVQRRNKTECDLYFQRDGQRVDPISASGGGAVDVAAFALRIAAWSMQTPRSRNTIILDEPLRFLSEDLQEQASRMIKELSERLGIQFVIITQEETLAQHADPTFEVRLRKGVSRIV